MQPQSNNESIHPIYIDIDEFDNAIDYLEQAAHFLSQLDYPYRWKWVAISLSSGLYGLMICALENGNPERVTDFKKMQKNDKQKIEVLRQKDVHENYMQEREIIEGFLHSKKAELISFDKALERIQSNAWMTQTTSSSAVKLTNEEITHIKEMRQLFRNNFEHYQPKLWAIHQERFLKPVESTLTAIEGIRESGNLFLRLYKHDRLTPLLDQLTQLSQKNRDYLLSMRQTG